MLVIWKKSIWLVDLFFVVFISVEGAYLSTIMYKFTQGGYLSLGFASVLMVVMGIWHYVHKQRYMFELNNKVSSGFIRELASNPDIIRVSGMRLLYSEFL